MMQKLGGDRISPVAQKMSDISTQCLKGHELKHSTIEGQPDVEAEDKVQLIGQIGGSANAASDCKRKQIERFGGDHENRNNFCSECRCGCPIVVNRNGRGGEIKQACSPFTSVDGLCFEKAWVLLSSQLVQLEKTLSVDIEKI